MFSQTCLKADAGGPIVRSRLRKLSLTGITSFLCAASLVSGADLSQAVVRQKKNVVTVAPTLNAQAEPAAQGAIIYDQNVVRTGPDSLAELEFSDRTLSRMTANAIFSFDAKARALNHTQGAVLFSKPTNSGPIQFRSGAISGAMTGSTVFLSTMTMHGNGKRGRSNGKETTTVIGMLEGKVHGASRWTDSAGREQTTSFKLGPGEMLVARSDSVPLRASFDIPRFLKTSPLVKGFKSPLNNLEALDRAVAAYQADERAGFIEKSNVRVSTQPVNMALVGQVVPPDVAAQILGSNANASFPFPGPDGVIRAQLVWNTAADLDLYLTLPTGQVVSFGNVSVTFNNGRAVAMLDRDNNGRTINFPPNTRVENIVVNGIPLAGIYRFMVNNFNSTNASDFFTLRVFYNGRLQLVTGSLAPGQNSAPVVVQVPRP